LHKNTGDLLRTLTDHKSGAISVAFVNNSMIVSGYADGTIKLWNKNNGDLLRTLPGHDGFIYSVAFDNNNMLASGSSDKTIKLWGFF